ncbi:MAG: putative DNA binding domain-containing protein [Anaerolineaceae bacterium]|nr:putative DNA binding domain-containing protein [Anaerolineaceae bacterium]
MPSRRKARMKWYRADLHLHTPASDDYQQRSVSTLDILRQAESRGLDIVAFTDHNTVGGYAAMQQEIEQLAWLEQLGRIQAAEQDKLTDYRRLLEKILVLPGFEFTATLGFHILGIYAPETPLRQLEHVLLSLNVPPEALEAGSSRVGASADVLTAYRLINEAGGICIAAHVNSTHGVAMRGVDFGGQTRIAYTQDPNLHALEVTDLTSRTRNSTQRFFSGTKPEYPRRMRCVQGSDAHRLRAGSGRDRARNLGIGDRVTEVQLPERSFPALLELFRSNDFSRSRPWTVSSNNYDYVALAREDGSSVIQSFHESMTRRGGRLYNIISDVCAFANGNGGTIWVGASDDRKQPPAGVSRVKDSIKTLGEAINSMLTPTLEVTIDALESQGKQVVRLRVPRGEDKPYAIEDYKIYVRSESETNLAVRDEIVNLVRQQSDADSSGAAAGTPAQGGDDAQGNERARDSAAGNAKESGADDKGVKPPRGGVEIVGTEQRNDVRYHVLRDLRNGNIVKNVTRSSARRLWHYAITRRENNPVRAGNVQWQGDIGLVRRYQRDGKPRFDLAQRNNGDIRVYYGVAESGMHGEWQVFLSEEEN